MSDMMNPYNVISSSEESTVISNFNPSQSNRAEYESEAELEKAFIKNLTQQGYSYLKVESELELLNNLRSQIERLNNIKFTDSDWDRFKEDNICNKQMGIVEKTQMLQVDYIREFEDKFGVLHNIKLIDKDDIHKNYLQVINQYTQETENKENRYDVTILVNGLPLVHIELKRRGVAIRQAFNQIKRYQRDSFWSNCGLFEFIQIFVISNGASTKYYSNTTRDGHIKEYENNGSKHKTSNSFEFTSFWSDEKNRNILDLIDFTKTFFAKRTLLNILIKYCVLTAENLLLVMRPYQIVATEKIVNKVNFSLSNKEVLGTPEAGGYIWHTTGSGKTLTSFKTAQLVSKIEGVDKVLFVVDRRDLDYQTKKEYDRFQKGAANGNTSSTILKRQLEDKDENGAYKECKIIVTTIQKLTNFLKKNTNLSLYNKHIVLIFDECHRSQFGEMHRQIIKNFKKYNLFGFTGTPIFASNSNGGTFFDKKSNEYVLMTTEQIFGNRLHTYTIINAIHDGNVLPFKVDTINTMVKKNIDEEAKSKQIDEKTALMDSKRIENVVKYMFDKYNDKTKRNDWYTLKGKRVRGFNSIFAVDTKEMAIKYYNEIKKQNLKRPENDRLKIAVIYTYGANEIDVDELITKGSKDREDFVSARECLESAISDYNEQFGSSFNLNGSGFEEYRDSISDKMKNRELDLLIVVDMFLTGFDSTTLNTLWVDKSLKQHGLIQAFSRTNRILNSVKICGNVICFRDLTKETEEAIALFGDAQARSIILLRDFNSYYSGYDEKVIDKSGKVEQDENGQDKTRHIMGYVELIEDVKDRFPLSPMRFDSNTLTNGIKKGFIALWSSILRMKNVLSCFDEFVGKEILSDYEFQTYQSIYLDFYDEFKKEVVAEREYINDDITFEMELVKSVDVDIDYILNLILKYHESNMLDKELYVHIIKSIESSTKLRSKKQLIEQFIEKFNLNKNKVFVEEVRLNGENKEEVLQNALTVNDMIGNLWVQFTNEEREKELVRIIEDNNLKEDETRKFVDDCFKCGVYDVSRTNSNFTRILPKKSFFSGVSKEQSDKIADVLNEFFNKYKNN